MITPRARVQQPIREAAVHTWDVEAVRPTSWDFSVSAAGLPVTTLSLTRYRDRGSFELDDLAHTLETEGFLRRRFRLKRGELTVARAETQGIFRPTFTISIADRVVTMRPRGFLGFTYLIEHHRSELGRIVRPSVFSRRTRVELDGRIDRASAVFMIFLAQVQWRRVARRHG